MMIAGKLKVSVLGMAMGAALLGSAAHAFEAPADPQPRAVSIAGLSDRITEKRTALYALQRDACFKMAGVEAKNSADQGSTSVQSVGTLAETLISGDEASSIDASLRRDIDLVEQYWAILSPALQRIAAGDFHPVLVQQALRLEPATQRLLSNIQDRLNEKDDGITGAEADQRASATTAQKMRVQQMTKDACFILSDIESVDTGPDLRDTSAAF